MDNKLFLITDPKSKPTNVWAELYPDSAPEDWLEILKDTKLPFVVSPLHDKDVQPDGTLKKPHWHILICWPGPTTGRRVLQIFRDTLHGPYPQEAISPMGCFRYMIHQDDPDKYQYDPMERKVYNGFDISKYDKLSADQELKLTWWLQRFIVHNKIINYSVLARLLLDTGHFFEASYLFKHTLHFKEFIRGHKEIMANCADIESYAAFEEHEYPAKVKAVMDDDDFKAYTELQLRRGD